jgi:hypothetical protein
LLFRTIRAAAGRYLQAVSHLWLVGAICAAGAVSTSAQAQSLRVERTVRLLIRPNTTFGVQGTPALSLPAPGRAAETPDGAATYALTTNTDASKEIRASLDEALPPGLSLEVKVGAPDSRGNVATSDGWTALRPAAERVVHDIQKSSDSGVPITYRAVATAQTAPEDYRITVTYTITRSD